MMESLMLTVEQKATASSIFNLVLAWGESNLPEGWELRVSFQRGEASISLIDPMTNDVDFCHDDCNMIESIERAVEHANEHDSEYE